MTHIRLQMSNKIILFIFTLPVGLGVRSPSPRVKNWEFVIKDYGAD
jgi:hypothetical protein